MLVGAVLAVLTAIAPPHVAARIVTGANPCGAVSAAGAVWVATDGAGTLVRIDPGSNAITRTIRLGRGSCSLAAGAGALYVTNSNENTVSRVDTATLEVARAEVPDPFDVLVAFDAVWATTWSHGSLVELDPRTLAVRRTIELGGYAAGLAARTGAVWVGFGRSTTAIARVDPRTGAVTRVRLGIRTPAWFARGTRDLWVQARDNRVVRVDPLRRRVLSITVAGATLALGALGPDGAVWMPDKQLDRIYRLDVRTGRVRDSFAAGNGAFRALRAFGSMWVTSYAGNDIWRFES